MAWSSHQPDAPLAEFSEISQTSPTKTQIGIIEKLIISFRFLFFNCIDSSNKHPGVVQTAQKPARLVPGLL